MHVDATIYVDIIIPSKHAMVYFDGLTRIAFHEIMTISCFCCSAMNSDESGGLV